MRSRRVELQALEQQLARSSRLLCPYCASAIEPSQVDLEAALRAETQTITLVDDIPLVPRPETRAADG